MKRLIASLTLLLAVFVAVPNADAAPINISQYVDMTMNMQGNYCTRWDAGTYQEIFAARFLGSAQLANKQGNQRGGLQARKAAHNALVATCQGEYPTFGIQL